MIQSRRLSLLNYAQHITEAKFLITRAIPTCTQNNDFVDLPGAILLTTYMWSVTCSARQFTWESDAGADAVWYQVSVIVARITTAIGYCTYMYI